MIVPPSVQSAKQILKETSNDLSLMDRKQVVAFATLSAWVHYYPSQMTQDDEGLLKSTEWIKKAEFSRYLKQRRIALQKILKEVDSFP